MQKFKAFILLNLLFIVVLVSACGNNKFEKNIVALDTVITLTAEGQNSKEALNEISDFIKQLDEKANFEEDSELTKINNLPANTELEISPEICEMLKFGKFYTDFTKKSYDVSAGALVSLWDNARKNEKLPTQKEIDFAKSTVNADNIVLGSNKVKKSNADTKVTFGGIAKGYAADKVISLYKANGLTGFMNFGTSTIVALGDKSYRIGIKNPNDPSKMLGVVTIKNAVLSTSGNYERFFTVNNVRYHHIIDTKTGYPANNGIASATVIVPLTCENAGVMSDVFSTALMIAGRKSEDMLNDKDTLKFLPEDAQALLINTDGVVIKINDPLWEKEKNGFNN